MSSVGRHGIVEGTIHQLLHGYNRGHRLLSGSQSLSDETRAIVDRLSDAVGTRPDRRVDGYLTGYPLPDGRYALARTWYAWELPRPNCVWTHTLLLDANVLARDQPLEGLLALFHRPESPQSDEYTDPLVLPAGDSLYKLTRVEVAIDHVVLAVLLDNLYQDDEDASWLELDDARSRDQLALAVWNQQWPRLRRRFAFCTGALEPRSLGTRSFDLSLAPMGRAGAFGQHKQSNRSNASPEARRLAQDLVEPSTDLRTFLVFAASGTGRRSTMSSLMRIWLALGHGTEFGNSTVDVIRRELIALAPEPESMRRLKRMLFHLPEAEAERILDPQSVLVAVTTNPLASTLLRDDASVGDWSERVWSQEPLAVLNSYRRSSKPSKRQAAAPLARVVDSARSDIEQAIKRMATTVDIPMLADDASETLLEILQEKADSAWWRSWAILPTGLLTKSLEAAHPRSRLSGVNCAALSSVLVSREVPRENVTAIWNWFARMDRSQSVSALVDALAGTSPNFDLWRRLTSGQAEELIKLLDRPTGDAQLAILADLLEPSALVLSRGVSPWRSLASSPSLARLERGLGLLMAVSLAAASPDPVFLGSVFAHLYRRLARNGSEEWTMIEKRLARPGDWDKCKRLTEGVARKLEHQTEGSRRAAVDAASAEDDAAANSLEDELAHRGLWSFWTDILRRF